MMSDLPTDSWDRHLAANRPDIGFMQSSWWADFLEGRGWETFGAFLRDGEEIVGGARVLVRSFTSDDCYFYVPEGPVLPDDDDDAEQVFNALLAFIDMKRRQQPKRVSHLRLEPRWHRRPPFVKGFREARSWLEPRHTRHVDLAPSPDEILAQMKPKGRYNIGVARRHGVRVVEDRSERGEHDFLDLYAETMRRHELGGKREDYIRDLIDLLVDTKCGTLLFAERDGQRLATAMVIFFGDRATYFFGGSLTAHRRVMAPYLLHFEAMLRARAMGCRWYDFYGIAPPGSTGHRWHDISVFKSKFGGEAISFVPSLDLIYDRTAYETYRRRKSKPSS